MAQEPRNLTVVEAAAMLGVSRPALSAFLNGRSDLSGTMALRIEKAFGVRVEKLMRMQADYDSARIRRQEELLEAGLRRMLAEPSTVDADPDALKLLPTWHCGQPRVDMADRDALYRLMEEE